MPDAGPFRRAAAPLPAPPPGSPPPGILVEEPATYARRPARPAPDQLARAHFGLVRKIAWHVHARVSTAIEVEDLIGIGMVALIEAANQYEDRGAAFASYASMRVRGAMIDGLRRNATMCRGAMARRKELTRARAALETKLGRAATEPELADAMGLAPAAFRELADASEATRQESLDEVYSDHAMWFADVGERADDALSRARLQTALAAKIGSLPEREAMVLQLYFVEELNLEEIGRTLGVTNARVCQIKKSALDRLRGELKDWR